MRCFRQGNPLSGDFVIRSILWKAGVDCNDTIFSKIIQLLAYANEMGNTSHIKWDITVAIECVFADMCLDDMDQADTGLADICLAVNEGKNKYRLLRSKDMRLIEFRC